MAASFAAPEERSNHATSCFSGPGRPSSASQQGVTDATWETFRAAIRDVRTDDLHVIASGASGGEGGGEAATIESVVTIVGPEGGACIAVSVSADGTVKAIRVNGDPVENCVGAQVPQSLP